MEIVTKIIIILLYPLLIIGRLLNQWLGRDPLRLNPPDTASFWIERGKEPLRASYFSDASEQEGRAHGGFGRVAGAGLLQVAAVMAPTAAGRDEEFRAAADRDQDIPDEVYTLW
jgi:hypothetical protein